MEGETSPGAYGADGHRDVHLAEPLGFGAQDDGCAVSARRGDNQAPDFFECGISVLKSPDRGASLASVSAMRGCIVGVLWQLQRRGSIRLTGAAQVGAIDAGQASGG